jgi:hypothetical protein
MAPNLLLLAKKAIAPWEWIKSKDIPNSIRKIYYSTVPMPGIYAITADKRHYLVAIRPQKGKKDTEGIFVPPKESWNVPKWEVESCNSMSREVTSQTAECSKNGKENSNYSKDALFTTAQTTTGSRYPSIKTVESYCLFCKSSRSTVIGGKHVYSVEFIVNGTGGHLPQQKSAFRKQIYDRSHHRISSFFHLDRNRGKCGIQEVDINGFKRLRRPLRIEFCCITKRWMFSTELQIRTEIVLVCSDITCVRKSHEACKEEVWRKMFVLDDGYSWVLVKSGGKGKKGVLYRVDEETECMRRQSREEMTVSKWFLEKARGRLLEYGEEADYMAVLRYVEKERVRERKENRYRERIEWESVELTRLQQARLEKERIEREHSKNEKVEKLRLAQRMTKEVGVWEGVIQKARVVEVEFVEV